MILAVAAIVLFAVGSGALLFDRNKSITSQPMTPAIPAGAAIVPAATVTIFPAGTPITGAEPGDLILVAHDSLMPKLIRFGQRIRYRGAQSEFAWCNHAGIVVTKISLVEMQARGGTQVMLADYAYKDVALVHPDFTTTEANEVALFAMWCVGIGYGWASIAATALDLLTGHNVSFGTGLRMICSAASARALEHGGIFTPDRNPTEVLPADLARYFGAVLSS